MKKLKKFLVLLLVAGLFSGLSGCDSGAGSAAVGGGGGGGGATPGAVATFLDLTCFLRLLSTKTIWAQLALKTPPTMTCSYLGLILK